MRVLASGTSSDLNFYRNQKGHAISVPFFLIVCNELSAERPNFQAVDGIANVHCQVHRGYALVILKIVDAERRRRGTADHIALIEDAEPSAKTLPCNA